MLIRGFCLSTLNRNIEKNPFPENEILFLNNLQLAFNGESRAKKRLKNSFSKTTSGLGEANPDTR